MLVKYKHRHASRIVNSHSSRQPIVAVTEHKDTDNQPSFSTMNDTRQRLLTDWTNTVLDRQLPGKAPVIELQPVSGDASFRRYFRARAGKQSFIAVDAPPENEDSRTFVTICNLLREAGVNAPEIYSLNRDDGFMLLADFGDELYLDRLLKLQQTGRLADADGIYQAAIASLIRIQSRVDKMRLDPYNRNELHREMALFEEWFCGRFLALRLQPEHRQLIADTLRFLEDAALTQTEVAVHRDYHSRNLMLLDGGRFDASAGPGIIDFQDAVRGAYTYDLVSLLRDAYIRWEPQQVEQWALDYLRQAADCGIVTETEPTQFLRDFDLMGLQRQLKVIGIFARLSVRDNKPRYLADIPLVIRYFLEVSRRYAEMNPFVGWFEQTVLPVAKTKLKLDY